MKRQGFVSNGKLLDFGSALFNWIIIVFFVMQSGRITNSLEFMLNSCLYQLWTVDVVQYIGSVLSFELSFLIKLSLILLVVSGLVGIYVTNSRRVEERVMYSDFVFPCIFCFFWLWGTFAQEIIPVLIRKNRALRLTTLNLILTQIRFLIKIDL